MLYRRFGRTELAMPVLSTGGMRYQDGWQDKPLDAVDPATTAMTRAVIERSMDVGITHVETARGYGPSERQLGTVLPELPRERLIVQTKIGPTDTAAEFTEHFEESLRRLRLDRVDLLAVHGINNAAVLDRAMRPGGCVEAARAIQSSGRAGHIGFSTHAPTPDLLSALDADDRGFDYVNLHFYFIFQRHRTAIERAVARDMGTFIISPTDKGGMLYDPPEKLVGLCDPLHPIVFNDLWTLTQPGVHTLSVGAARPSDFDLHLEAVRILEAGDAEAVLAPIVQRLGDAMEQAIGERDPEAHGAGGLPEALAAPGGLNLPVMLWLRNLALGWDMTTYGKKRFNMLGGADHWFPGAKGDTLADVPESELAAAVAGSPHAASIPAYLRQSVELLAGEAEKRLSES
ncbi:aldo/keto reductase [Phycisphaera mikurensis]|uniref:Putative aldo/keto reductase n=1 Tax=Phycisphaera mikurensis (strain NBRC 102666 / KCTC 22515 / FYK2301M01) TaxID=1142394 RepID=I0IGC2_PHYMF|nr:aldo/keto reductase [Phycisphaera mikurensis]MBB6440311.1 hypothetical protein [Phycisphaera mikurensis]BAM04310.1 putative aldo/keto reductase [Phycisphaera mikurensis NBRC 102666]